MRVKKEYIVACIECGYKFVAYSPKALRCPECRERHIREAALLRHKSKTKGKDFRKNKNLPKMSISETLKALKKYNEENGVYLSYGTFVSLMERGEINVGE